MREATARALNALNQALYADRAGEWDAVRERPWRGFERAIGWLAALRSDPLRVLDVGCGNGGLSLLLADLRPDLLFLYFLAKRLICRTPKSRMVSASFWLTSTAC